MEAQGRKWETQAGGNSNRPNVNQPPSIWRKLGAVGGGGWQQDMQIIEWH